MKIEERNLIERIESCLKEHKVDIGFDKQIIPFYLIECGVESPLHLDFCSTYPEIDTFKKKLAEKLMSKKQMQTYGVFVDSGLKYSFAFNRAFADLNDEKSGLLFSSPEDILIKASEGIDLSEFSEPQPSPLPHFPITIRYAIAGSNRDKKDKGKVLSEIELNKLFGRPSLLDRIKRDYQKQQVLIEGENFFLIKTQYETSTLEDFIATYGEEVDDFKIKLAKKIFGTGKTSNQYGILFDENLMMNFAFNSRFATYDLKDSTIRYLSVEEALLKDISGKPIFIPPKKPSLGPSSGGTTFRYAIVGKK
jgi:hypothetical protein